MADKPAADAPKKRNPQVDALIKHHFWILGGALLLTTLIVWWLGVGKLDAQFETDVRTNKSAFSAVDPIRYESRTNAPPNGEYKKLVDGLRATLSKGVKDAWNDLYVRQAEVLKMNAKVEKELGELILLEPPERAAREKADPKITAAREVFHNNQIIEEDFRALFAMLDLRRAIVAPAAGAPAAGGAAPAVAAAPVAPGGAAPQSAGVEGILVWKAPLSPDGLMARYRTRLTPSIDRIAVTQEDLWLFRSMFGVIKSINSKPIDTWLQLMNTGVASEEALRVDQANVPIKQIDYCDVAQYAMSKAYGEPGVVKEFAGEGDASAFTGGGKSTGFNVGAQGTAEEDERLLTGRYIDGRNHEVEDPSKPPIAEFRQVFVQMTVLMDQRLIPVLIAECAGAPLPIETRQVRIDLQNVDVLRAADAAASAADVTKVERSPHDALVTLRGVVYIYVKPDDAKLGKGSDPEPGKRDYGIPIPTEEPIPGF